MSRYAVTGFGFSFWYPTAWKVTEEAITDPTRDGWFPDGMIVKELQIRPAADEDNQSSGVILEEVLAPKGLTELGRSKSPSPVGVDHRYYFNKGTHQWMDAQLTEAPDGTAPTTAPLEIRQRTMGGLPLFLGAVRGGLETIVPLDEAHFVAVIAIDSAGDGSNTYLAKTLAATHPDANKQASEQVQVDTIRREAVKFQLMGEPIGFWYKDDQHVYNFDGGVLAGADPKTFARLSDDGPNALFATDGVHVYMSYEGVIPGADPKTFRATGDSTAKDSRHTYDWSSGSLKISDLTARE